MKKKTAVTIISLGAVILFIILGICGAKIISQIGMAFFSVITLLSNLKNAKTMRKKILFIAISNNIVMGCMLFYFVFFYPDNTYLMYGSLICFFISFPVSLAIVSIYKKGDI